MGQILQSYRVELFGPCRVVRGSADVAVSAYEAALVGVVYGQEECRIARADAAALIWGSADSCARHRLSELIYSLKQKTGVALVTARGEELVPAGDGVTCDVWDFAGLCESHEVSRAEELLRRGLLRRVALPPSKNLEEWIEEAESRLRRLMLRTAQEIWVSAERTSDWARGVDAARAAYRVEPWNEEWLRRLMTAYAMTGNLGSAAGAYEDHVRWLAEISPGATPVPETQRLLERIAGAPRTTGTGAGEKSREEPRLCGRRDELARLRELLLRPPSKQMCFVVIRGEGGVGKTRLVEEWLKEVPLRGGLLLRSRADELESRIPLNLLSEALSGQPVLARVGHVSEPWRGVLANVLPELGTSAGERAIPGLEPVAAQRRLLEAIRQLFQTLTKEERVFLVLDDFHCADATSIAALEYTRRRWEGGDLTVVVACRTEGETRSSEVARFVSRLEREGTSLVLDLSELAQPDAEALVREVAKEKLSVGEVSQILMLAGGVPFFLIELTLERLVARSGVRGESGELTVPISVRQLLDERVSRVSRNAGMVLDVLAVLGRPASSREVCAVARRARGMVIDCLDELERVRLVRWKRVTVCVSHELMREARYRGMGEAKRRWLHRRAALYLRRREPGELDRSPCIAKGAAIEGMLCAMPKRRLRRRSRRVLLRKQWGSLRSRAGL